MRKYLPNKQCFFSGLEKRGREKKTNSQMCYSRKKEQILYLSMPYGWWRKNFEKRKRKSTKWLTSNQTQHETGRKKKSVKDMRERKKTKKRFVYTQHQRFVTVSNCLYFSSFFFFFFLSIFDNSFAFLYAEAMWFADDHLTREKNNDLWFEEGKKNMTKEMNVARDLKKMHSVCN